MGWLQPRPLPQWGDPEHLRWDQEVWDRIVFGSFTWNPPSVAANTTSQFVVSSVGPAVISTAPTRLRVGNPVKVTAPSALPNGLTLDGFVSSNDAVTIVLANLTGGPLTAPSGTWAILGVVT